MKRSLSSFENLPGFPFTYFPSLFEDTEELLPASIWTKGHFFQGLAVSEDKKNVYVEASVPGIDPKHVEVTYAHGILTIKGEKSEQEKEKTYQKKSSKSFFYQVAPGDVDPAAEPQATYKHGVMTVSFPKINGSKGKTIPVNIA